MMSFSPGGNTGRLELALLGQYNSNLKKRAYKQVRREPDLVEKLDLAGYFLIVWDLVRFCKEEGFSLF